VRAEASRLQKDLHRAAPIFFALGDETRLRIVGRLCRGGPSSIARLTEGLPVTRQAVSKHLQVLADAGLARTSRAGRESVWQIEPDQIEQARRCLADISQQWDTALVRLKRLVEGQGSRSE
jgi:DNA-binding transcriptional ArsR family regulator